MSLQQPRKDLLIFERRDPQRYILLYTRVGPEGAMPESRYQRPPSTEYATEAELRDLGWVESAWKVLALLAIGRLADEPDSIVWLRENFEVEVGEQVASKLLAVVHSELSQPEQPDDVRSPEQRGVAVILAEGTVSK